LSLLSLLLSPPPAPPSTPPSQTTENVLSLIPVTLSNAVDTWVSQARPAANYADGIYLRTAATTGGVLYSYIYFSRPFPLGATITSAVLHLRQVATVAGTRSVTAKRTLQQWNVARLTYGNQPTVSAAVATVSKTASPASTVWDLDITTMMQQVSDGASWYGLRIETTDTTPLLFWSAQAPSLKPTLDVTWTDAPEAPSTLTPSSGSVVSLAQPLVRFDFTDHVGNTALQAVQVQSNASNVWTAPTFDSGTVVSSVPQLDLATTAFPALADGASTWWRVRVQDAAGVWSPWSLGAQITRSTKGTLTITIPAASPNNFVSEATPPISWTFTGRTQTAHLVYINNAAGATIFTSGKLTSNATTLTLAKGLIHDGQTYTVGVRIWDQVTTREAAGDPIYTQATRAFTYNLSATVAPVTSLTSTDLTPVPALQLDWTRTTAPDSYTIVRDGRVIASDLVPSDLLVSGTSYRYVDNGADPKVSHTWSVRSVVNGVTSSSNPTATKTLSPVGIWLKNPTTGVAVQLVGSANGTWTSGEDAAIYTPVGGTRVVRVTQALRGFEGSIEGELLSFGTTNVQTSIDNMYALKENPGARLWLTFSEMTIPVIIGNVNLAPVRGGEIRKLVTFDFWQVGDLPFDATL
jgi:hypothetical protein